MCDCYSVINPSSTVWCQHYRSRDDTGAQRLDRLRSSRYKEIPEGGHTLATRVGGAPYPLGVPPASWAPWWPSGTHLLLYEVFRPEKIISKLTGRNSAVMRRNLGGTNLGPRRSCSAGETSLQEGEIITLVITNDPLIGRASISINIFTSTISSQNPSSSPVSNLVSKPQIGTCGLLVVLITPCS